jgi:hypothetical protein
MSKLIDARRERGRKLLLTVLAVMSVLPMGGALPVPESVWMAGCVEALGTDVSIFTTVTLLPNMIPPCTVLHSGQTVTWTNRNLVQYASPANECFSAGILRPGERYSVTLAYDGTHLTGLAPNGSSWNCDRALDPNSTPNQALVYYDDSFSSHFFLLLKGRLLVLRSPG